MALHSSLLFVGALIEMEVVDCTHKLTFQSCCVFSSLREKTVRG